MAEHTPFPWVQGGTFIFSPDHGIVCQLSLPHPTDGLLEHTAASWFGEGDEEQWLEAMANGQVILSASEVMAENEHLKYLVRLLRAELKELEWCDESHGGPFPIKTCPCCLTDYPQHEMTCTLDSALKLSEGV